MGGAGGGVMARPGGRGDGLWGMLPSPSSVWPPASHLPPPGGRLIAAPTDTTVQSCKCQCPKPSPSRGKVAPPEAVTDEGEKTPRAAQRPNSKVRPQEIITTPQSRNRQCPHLQRSELWDPPPWAGHSPQTPAHHPSLPPHRGRRVKNRKKRTPPDGGVPRWGNQ